MTLVQCLQLAKDAGFDGIELNYDLESDLSPKAGTREFQQIRSAADRIGIAISGLCSFLFWPFPLTSKIPQSAHAGSTSRTRWRMPRMISEWRTCWSSPARCIFRGGTITSPCRTTCAIAVRAKPSRPS